MLDLSSKLEAIKKTVDDEIKNSMSKPQSMKQVAKKSEYFHTAREFLTPKELAQILSVSLKTLERWRKSGKSPAFIKVWNERVRYPVASLDQWVRDNLKKQDTPESSTINTDSK